MQMDAWSCVRYLLVGLTVFIGVVFFVGVLSALWEEWRLLHRNDALDDVGTRRVRDFALFVCNLSATAAVLATIAVLSFDKSLVWLPVAVGLAAALIWYTRAALRRRLAGRDVRYSSESKDPEGDRLSSGVAAPRPDQGVRVRRAAGDSEPLKMVIGGTEFERVQVTVLRRANPGSFDAGDGNWLEAEVELAIGRFRGAFACRLRAQDFADFLPQLRRLHAELVGSARFTTAEDQIQFSIVGDGKGHLEVSGDARDRVDWGDGPRLTWSLSLDQTYLPELIASVAAITEAYEVRGTRAL